jgi:hypothetical protein
LHFRSKKDTNFSAVFFSLLFGHQNPGSGSGFTSNAVSSIQHREKVWEKFSKISNRHLIGDRGLDLVEECSELLVREPGDPEEMQHL